MIRSTKDLLTRKGNNNELPPVATANKVSERAQSILKQLDATPSPPPSALPVAAPRRKSQQDDDGVDDLRRRVESQKAELDNRTDSVNAIQRNFQRLSEMYSSDRQKLVNAESEIVRLLDELSTLRAEKKLFSALQTEFSTLRSEHEGAVTTIAAERSQNEIRTKKLEELLRVAERETKMLSASLNKAAKESQLQTEDHRRIEASLQTAENNLNGLLLCGMEFQKKIVDLALSDELRSEALKSVGCGIAFVSTLDSDPRETVSLRLEIINKALENCSRDCFGALERAVLSNLRHAKSEVAHFADENEKSRILRAETQQKIDDLKRQIDSAEKRVSELADANRQLKGEHSSIINELDALRNSLQERNANSNVQTNELQTLLDRVTCDRDALKRSNEELETECARQLADMTGCRNREVVILKELEDAKQKFVAELSESGHQLESEKVSNRKLSDTVNSLRAEITKIRASVAQHSASTSITHQEKESALRSRIDTLERSMEEVKAELHATDSNRAVIKQEYEVVCAELAVAHETKQRNALAIASLESARLVAEKQLFDSEKRVTELMAERSQLLMDSHSSIDSLQTLNDQLTQHRETITRLSNDRSLQETDNRRLKEELQRANDSIRSLDPIRLKNQQHLDEIAELKSTILNAAALSQLNQEKIQSLSKQLADSDAKLASATRELQLVRSTQSSFDDQRQSLELQKKEAELRSRHLREVQEETLKTVKKLIHVEKACESGYSCLGCLQLLKDPVQCAPCGHTFCRRCFEEDSHNRDRKSQGKYCPECDENNVSLLVPSKSLDLLTGKFQYRCQVLADLCAKLEKDA